MIDAAEVWPVDASSAESAAVSLDPLADLWVGAEVVGVGWTARTVRELHVIADGLVRVLVGRLGFGSLLIEGDREVCKTLDRFVTAGTGDPWASLTGARPFLATEELLTLVLWLRHHNEHRRRQRVRIVHGGVDDLSSAVALEHSLATEVVSWHERYGDRIVYLGGAFHTAVAERASTLAANEPVRAAGSLLRERFGHRYCSVGLTFGSGAIPQPVPPPAPGFLEARLDTLGHPTTLINVHDARHRRLITGTNRIRIVGPDYDPDHDPDHSMIGDPAAWFDAIVHQKVATSVSFIN